LIKDLVVNLAPVAERDPATEFAISIAEAFEAHIAGISFAYEPIITPTVMDGLSAAWIDTQREDNFAAAQAAVDRFEAAVRRRGLSAEHRLLEASLGSAATLFGAIARRYDLAVVGQSGPDRMARDDLMVEAALLESGRPVIVVPFVQTMGLKLDRVLVCWDASRSAARALADAMPLLRRTGAVEIVSVTAEGNPEELTGADVGDHLARHDLKVEVRRLAKGDVDIANTILSYAADAGADFIVMGGYGHSRLREFVLGGVTRGILGSMTVPVLMSH
jgi:nucleotide-binding universal stress UspA family protein